MAWIGVKSLAELKDLIADGVPQLIKFVGVEAVRSAPEVVRLADGIKKIVPDAEGEVAIFLYHTRGSSSSEEEMDAAAGEVDHADLDLGLDDDADVYWVVEGLPDVRRVSRLAGIATELADEVLPALTASPDDLLLLKRLRELGRDVRRAGLLEEGDARANAVILGNRAQKIAYRARRHPAIAYRTAVSRSTYVGDRVAELVAKVNAVLDSPVVFQAS